jgi:sulfopyruvate decarboxylase subunit alpha
MTPGKKAAWARRVARGIAAVGCRDVVYVPDNALAQILSTFEEEFPEMRATIATREEEAFGIAAGLYLGGGRPTVMMAASGLGNSLTVLTSLQIAYQIPTLIVVSMRGEPGEWNWAQVPLGRALRPLLDTVAIQRVEVESEEDAEHAVRLAGNLAFNVRMPVACLLPRRLTASSLESATR